MAKAQRKTKTIKALQGNYGRGWEDLCTYEEGQEAEAVEDLEAYDNNEMNTPHRLISRRIPNPDYKPE